MKLNKLESERDLSQTIVHFDLDSFFASVEVLNDPTLDGKAFAVCAYLLSVCRRTESEQVGHTVISTASYAARKFGVRSGMASKPISLIPSSVLRQRFGTAFIAKKLCPELIMVSHGMSDYSDMSKKVMAICKRFGRSILIRRNTSKSFSFEDTIRKCVPQVAMRGI